MQPEDLDELERMSLSFSDLARANEERRQQIWTSLDWGPVEWAFAAVGEMGELCNKIKKRELRREDIDLDEIRHEVGDILTYLDLLCAEYGVDMGECVREKFNIVSDRHGSSVKL